LENGVFYRLKIGKRKTNKRQPPVALPSRLLAHMRRWVDREIVCNHFVEWHGKAVTSVKNGFGRGVAAAKLDISEGNVTPHTLRHTAATWLMQRGADLWQSAGFLGMSVQVLIDTYGHHHPHHMREAAEAITSKARIQPVRRNAARPKVA
jgi:integrase